MKKWILSSVVILTVVACSKDSPKNYFAPFTKEKKVTDGSTSDVFEPNADILFVVDNSGSMLEHQRTLADNVRLFTSIFLQNSIMDYHIGVITTDAEGFLGAECCGQLVGSTRVVTRTTPNSNSVLQRNLMVGTGGSGTEMPFQTTSLALSPAMLSSHNADFIRPTAGLIVIFLTDTEDQSNSVSAQRLLDQLLLLKNNDKRRLLAFGAIIPSNVSGCTRDGNLLPEKIEEFLDIVPNGKSGGGKGDNAVSLCAPDYGQRLAEFALQIVDSISSTIYLSRLPDPNSLRVTYGSIDLPQDDKKGWSYNARKNVILLGPDIDWTTQPAGSRVEVHYKEARG